MTLFQSIFVPLCFMASAVVLARTVRRSIGWRSGLLWTAVWSAAGMFIARPRVTSVVAGWLGIGRGADLVLYVAVLAGLGVSWHFYSRHRRVEMLITGLIRREALNSPRRGTRPSGPIKE